MVCGATIGRYAFVGAGAVVRGDVPDYALMLGVPAVRKGWMSRHGHRLTERDGDGNWACPESRTATAKWNQASCGAWTGPRTNP